MAGNLGRLLTNLHTSIKVRGVVVGLVKHVIIETEMNNPLFFVKADRVARVDGFLSSTRTDRLDFVLHKIEVNNLPGGTQEVELHCIPTKDCFVPTDLKELFIGARDELG